MKIKVLTLFPEMYTSFLSTSILKRAIGKGIIDIDLINIRDYTKDKYGRVDTPPIGGGAGLIMKCQPIIDCIRANSTSKTHKIILAPRGKTYNQDVARKLSCMDEILIMCGHYEGVDERVYDYFDEIISIGDFILTGGETASFCIIDSVSRLIKGVISDNSILEESFQSNLLEYPQYTEPYNFEDNFVPNILYSGNHTAITKYQKKKAFEMTKKYRPDLYNKNVFTKNDLQLIKEIETADVPKWETEAIEKGKKFTKNH